MAIINRFALMKNLKNKMKKFILALVILFISATDLFTINNQDEYLSFNGVIREVYIERNFLFIPNVGNVFLFTNINGQEEILLIQIYGFSNIKEVKDFTEGDKVIVKTEFPKDTLIINIYRLNNLKNNIKIIKR